MDCMPFLWTFLQSQENNNESSGSGEHREKTASVSEESKNTIIDFK